MWNLIADLIQSYTVTGQVEQALEVLAQTLAAEPMWIPHAQLDERLAGLWDLPEFQKIAALPPEDGPALFNAALVALEYSRPQIALEHLRRAFQLAVEDETLPFLLEALQEEAQTLPALSRPPFSELVAEYAALLPRSE